VKCKTKQNKQTKKQTNKNWWR